MKTLARGRSLSLKRVFALLAGVALVVAVLADTRFLDPEASSAHHQEQFDPASYAEEHFPEIAGEIAAQATDVTVLVPALREDLAEAGAAYGNDLGAGQYAFPVTATGTVSEVDDNFITLEVPGLPDGAGVRIPLDTALSGIPVRDATGSIGFGDFHSQTDFQSVANEFKILIRESVLAPAEPAALAGEQITVVGAYGSGGPDDLYLIHPVSIEVTP